jgi:Entner-Doudoroff aldolase
VVLGAGTVIQVEDVTRAASSGARFIVSPGLDWKIVRAGQQQGLTVLPGVCTASEIQSAYRLGLRTVKFFPAEPAGGTRLLKALSAPFQDMSFIPTGGITLANAGGYLELECVLACGSSALADTTLMRSGDFSRISQLAAEATNEPGSR